MTLQYPNMREELLDHLRELGDAAFQREHWPDAPGLDEAVHFLFDDTALANDAQATVGVFLREASEADAVSKVVHALETVLTRHGNDLADSEYIAVPEWPLVLESARRAYELLRANDDS